MRLVPLGKGMGMGVAGVEPFVTLVRKEERADIEGLDIEAREGEREREVE